MFDDGLVPVVAPSRARPTCRKSKTLDDKNKQTESRTRDATGRPRRCPVAVGIVSPLGRSPAEPRRAEPNLERNVVSMSRESREGYLRRTREERASEAALSRPSAGDDAPAGVRAPRSQGRARQRPPVRHERHVSAGHRGISPVSSRSGIDKDHGRREERNAEAAAESAPRPRGATGRASKPFLARTDART